MGQLEQFLHDASPDLPVLVKAALAHVQFETIHPFLDGNGRVGRLLITFILCAEGVLREPLLYLSLYLKQHRDRYYDLLQTVRTRGDWESWLDFFLDAVLDTSTQAAETATEALALFEADRRRLQDLGKAAGSALRLHEHLQRHPLSSIRIAHERLGLSLPAIAGTIDRLVAMGLLREITGRRRDRVFAYDQYLALLASGTEPLARAVAP
jgi:Fic family protein